MTDDDTTEREADALAASQDLERRVCAVLNDPTQKWAAVPHVVTTALAEVLVRVLVAMAQTHAEDLAFGLRLIDQVQRQLITRAAPSSTPRETRH